MITQDPIYLNQKMVKKKNPYRNYIYTPQLNTYSKNYKQMASKTKYLFKPKKKGITDFSIKSDIFLQFLTIM